MLIRVAARLAALAAWLIYGAGISSALAQSPSGDPELGRAAATSMCASCHLVSEGQAHPAMDSAPSFDALARDRAMTENRLRGFLNRPHPPMPDPQLSRPEIDNIVSYILQRRRGAT
jgi:mono/diheme cytochrome c family protein